MAISAIITTLKNFIMKYKYPLIALSLGVVILTIPNLFESQQTGEKYLPATEITETDICNRIKEILSNVAGVGKVDVMISIDKGEMHIYQTDDRISQSAESTTTQIETVMITDAQRDQSGLIKQIIPEAYRGAIIVCDGADSPTVRFAVIDAVSKITGLNSNQISIMKMK